jgi:hypothetical protein
MNFFYILLQAHSGIRWIILLAAIVVILKSLIGLFGNGKYGKFDNILAASFVGFMHLQALIGVILYFISPIAQQARSVGMGNMMADSNLRFWGMEHIVLMVLAVVAAQVGRSISKKASDASVKFRFQAIFFGIAILLVLLGIPWARI